MGKLTRPPSRKRRPARFTFSAEAGTIALTLFTPPSAYPPPDHGPFRGRAKLSTRPKPESRTRENLSKSQRREACPYLVREVIHNPLWITSALTWLNHRRSTCPRLWSRPGKHGQWAQHSRVFLGVPARLHLLWITLWITRRKSRCANLGLTRPRTTVDNSVDNPLFRVDSLWIVCGQVACQNCEQSSYPQTPPPYPQAIHTLSTRYPQGHTPVRTSEFCTQSLVISISANRSSTRKGLTYYSY